MDRIKEQIGRWWIVLCEKIWRENRAVILHLRSSLHNLLHNTIHLIVVLPFLFKLSHALLFFRLCLIEREKEERERQRSKWVKWMRASVPSLPFLSSLVLCCSFPFLHRSLQWNEVKAWMSGKKEERKVKKAKWKEKKRALHLPSFHFTWLFPPFALSFGFLHLNSRVPCNLNAERKGTKGKNIT